MKAAIILLAFVAVAFSQTSALSKAAARRVMPRLKKDFARAGLRWGAPVFIRTYKSAGRSHFARIPTQRGTAHQNRYADTKARVEIWVQGQNGKYVYFGNYGVCAYSGTLGTKTRQGDMQTPEGFYEIKRFNPWSSYHLSFDVGYPNALERRRGNTGGDIMIHGSCGSIGCFAITDRLVEEVYTLVYAARAHGQRKIPVHSFPFPMTDANLASGLARWPSQRSLWLQLQEGWRAFEETKVPPKISWARSRYGITPRGPGRAPSPPPPRAPTQSRPSRPSRPSQPQGSGSGRFKYQVGAFSSAASANRLARAAHLTVVKIGGLYRVRSVRRYRTASEAKAAARSNGHTSAVAVRA